MATSIPRFLRTRRRLSQAVQLINLMRMIPESSGSLEKADIRSTYDGFRASSCSGVYRIEIEGKREGKPIIWLSGGSIDRQSAKEAPHKFGIDENGPRIQLCLDRFNWQPDQLYSQTYIPWAMEWIIHFEIWRLTGKWTGGGIHPSVDEA